ncbi:MAG: hypothetical protein H0W36_06940 [Gemmatimonadetes bacterium]|nr:hypothetical protein [Gemmatimonadota bacterium]
MPNITGEINVVLVPAAKMTFTAYAPTVRSKPSLRGLVLREGALLAARVAAGQIIEWIVRQLGILSKRERVREVAA